MPSKFKFVILTSMLVSICISIHVQADDQVWVWNSKCNKPTQITLNVQLDGKTVFSTLLPLCRMGRDFEDGKTNFKLTPARALVWYGYRSEEDDGKEDKGDPTPAGAELEVDFWQAGGESDAIELGYSVSASDGLHMNSIHLLSPTKKVVTTMAPGLILVTQVAPVK